MRAIILAAGAGIRLMPITNYFPKSFLTVGGYNLIEHQLKALYDNRVYDIDIVVGHLAFMFEKKIKEFVKYPMSVRLINNPNYYDTNTLYSLQLALEKDASTTLVINGDVYFKTKHIEKFMQAGNYVGIDRVRKKDCQFSGEEVVVDFSDYNSFGKGYRIDKIGKETRGRSEAIGIYRIESSFTELLLENMHKMPKNKYYEDAMTKMLHCENMHTKTTPGVIEVDTESDLIEANRIYQEKRD